MKDGDAVQVWSSNSDPKIYKPTKNVSDNQLQSKRMLVWKLACQQQKGYHEIAGSFEEQYMGIGLPF